MKSKSLLIAIIAGIFIFFAAPSEAQDDPVAPFVGMWALSLDYEDNNAGHNNYTDERRYDAKQSGHTHTEGYYQPSPLV